MSPAYSGDYLTTEVLTATPQKLHLLLIEGAIRTAGQARHHLAGQRWEAAHDGLTRSQSIVAELMSRMDPHSADPLVQRLAGIYLYVYRTLVAANLERNQEKINEALSVLDVERETWRQVCAATAAAAEDAHVGGALFVA